MGEGKGERASVTPCYAKAGGRERGGGSGGGIRPPKHGVGCAPGGAEADLKDGKVGPGTKDHSHLHLSLGGGGAFLHLSSQAKKAAYDVE